jgi:uncharacterized membrane protein SpoIIM required for sporulation
VGRPNTKTRPAGRRQRAGDSETKLSKSELTPSELEGLERLRSTLKVSQRTWSDEQLVELPRLYSLACTVLARLEAQGARPRISTEVRRLVDRAQVALFRNRDLVGLGSRGGLFRVLDGLRTALLVRGPRALRSEWRLLAGTFSVLYGLAIISWVAVSRDLDLAYSLLSPEVVDNQIQQLEAVGAGEKFRGNFTFGLGESPATAAMIMVHNMGVGVLFFAAALIPPLYLLLLSTNSLMLGTYTAVAGHWGQAGSISSIIWCHGVLEIQAIGLAGTAGLVLVRALLFPGALSRRVSLSQGGRLAMDLYLPVFALLFIAGLIEGFISPHAPLAVRLFVAVTSGVLLLIWALFCGREVAGERDQRARTGLS